MNPNKICFIYCTNDEQLYAESVKYVQSLYIPTGFEVDIIAVTNASSITEGYNKAMQQSDAKYKVYLHQDVLIVNKNFISDVVGLFTQHRNLGLLGLAGGRTLPLDGIWRKSSKKLGEFLEYTRSGEMKLVVYGEVSVEYEKAQAVDGSILITQYDVRWRDDLFKGWAFYDASQCMEFQRAGYDVGVVGQAEPWCVHDCVQQKINVDKKLQQLFLNEYTEDLWPYMGGVDHQEKFPLVSVLIRVYNQTNFFKEALESVLTQTYPNIEIIVGDDSTNDRVREFITPYLIQYKNITYYKNESKEIDYGYSNTVNCFKRSKGDYVNFLNHDDIFHSEKIERMMRWFMENPDIKLVTSARQPFADGGDFLPLGGSFTRIFQNDTLISGYDLSRIVISNLRNLIGEPTTVLFKRKYVNENQVNYFNGVHPKYVGDIANWFTVLRHGDAVYIADTLSYIRIHASQNTQNPKIVSMSIDSWYKLIQQSFAVGIIQNTEEYKKILNLWMKKYVPIPDYFVNSATQEQREQVSNCFKEAIDVIVTKTVKEEFECPVCNQTVEKFLPYRYKRHTSDFIEKFQIIGSNVDNFRCPKCYCHDRMRHLMIFFNKLNIWDECIDDKKILHIAPELHLRHKISEIKTKHYICGDLYPPDSSITKVDITNTTFEDDYFDLVICNHVLEHIPDDTKAMKELYRILNKGGKAVLQTPYSPLLNESFEDDTLTSEHQRKHFYGQKDHVRVYGMDFFERLKSAGFTLRVVKNDELFSEEESRKYGVNDREDFILVEKQ